MIKTNYLVIGSGVAGLTFAIKMAEKFPYKTVTVVTKSNADESNTKYAQGGIAIVIDKIEDNFKKHIDDTLICGDGLCDKKVVEIVVKEGPKRLQELIKWGAQFDINDEGSLDLGREGGHSTNRVVHHKDQTGIEIERTILLQARRKKNIKIIAFHFALELITKNNKCFGAYILNEKTKEIFPCLSHYTILATGGIGQVYGHTTNPKIATGDGIAMAKRAKARITDMEFIQFHPTALYSKNLSSTFLISEAVRGFGGILRTKDGFPFMQNYDSRGDLASRDIVSRSIEAELNEIGEDCVYLDCTHLDMISFKKHFPMIYQRCYDVGIYIEKDWIPVVPAQHYLCGGIDVDLNGQTSIKNLFACGECSRTGLHGANRLASNSLLEALVFSDKIFNHLRSSRLDETYIINLPIWDKVSTEKINTKYIEDTKVQLQILMQQNVRIMRNDDDLEKTKEKLYFWRNEIELLETKSNITKELYELKNLIDVSCLIVEQSIDRKENRGGFKKQFSFPSYSHKCT